MTTKNQVLIPLRGSEFQQQLRVVGLYLLMSFLLIFPVVPFIWMFGSAFRPVTEIFEYVYPLSWNTFVPVNFTAENFTQLLFAEGSMWPRYIFNSVFVAVTTVVAGGLVNALAAYSFARLRFPGRDILFLLVLLTIIVPFEAIALPLYQVSRILDWLDTYQVLIVPVLANAFSIFLLRQFFLGIPSELEDAALVDGASRLRIFFQIVVPLSWPAIISTSLITFQASWDAFFWPLIATSSPEVRVIQIAVSNLVGQDATYWDDLFAAVAIAALVPMILFFIFQRYYTVGITTTGLKG